MKKRVDDEVDSRVYNNDALVADGNVAVALRGLLGRNVKPSWDKGDKVPEGVEK